MKGFTVTINIYWYNTDVMNMSTHDIRTFLSISL